MKILLLAAGYGTRLQKDISEIEKYKHLRNTPKALVPLGHFDALISIWLHIIERDSVQTGIYKEDVFLVTNDLFYEKFQRWALLHKMDPKKQILNDGTNSNVDRLGAVADLKLAIDRFQLTEDLVIIASDTIFYRDFPFTSIAEKARDDHERRNVVLYYECPTGDLGKTGILELDSRGQVSKFLEKPSVEMTESRKACPCFYVLRTEYFELISEFLLQHQHLSKEHWDAPGKLISWMVNTKKVSFLGIQVQNRLDVGDLKTYIEANEYFTSQRL